MNREPEIIRRVLAAKGNSIKADELIRAYMPFIRSEAAKSTGKIPYGDHDDILSIAMIGFHEAIERYEEHKGAFLSFAAVIIKSRIIDYIRKEQRHAGLDSMDSPAVDDDSGITLADTIADKKDAHEEMVIRDAAKQEILELTQQLQGFGLSLTDIADNCPKQHRTLESCRRAIRFAKENPVLIDELVRTGRLPVSSLSAGAGVERKTLERHRKYLMAVLIIYSNGYEVIRGHLKQIFEVGKVGAAV